MPVYLIINECSTIFIAQYQSSMILLNKQSADRTCGQNSQDHTLLASKFCLLVENACKSGWLIHSSSTDHIYCDFNLFYAFKFMTGIMKHIVVPDGRRIPNLHIKSVQVSKNMILHNVVHIPDFTTT